MLESLVKTQKWLCIGLYKSPSQNESYFLEILSKVLSRQTWHNLKKLFWLEVLTQLLITKIGLLMNTFNLKSLINKPTCFQSANPTCNDLILTNKKSLFRNSYVLVGWISDHHSLINTALGTHVIKWNVKMKMYRCYKTFNIELFKREIHTTFDYLCFQNIFIALPNKHAPIKKKTMGFSNNPFMSKGLRNAIIPRSKLKNIYNKYRTEDNWANYSKEALV